MNPEITYMPLEVLVLSFAAFSDPDGNGWVLQEVTTRLPGRIDPGHNWPAWYASYMVAEQTGAQLPV